MVVVGIWVQCSTLYTHGALILSKAPQEGPWSSPDTNFTQNKGIEWKCGNLFFEIWWFLPPKTGIYNKGIITLHFSFFRICAEFRTAKPPPSKFLSRLQNW